MSIRTYIGIGILFACLNVYAQTDSIQLPKPFNRSTNIENLTGKINATLFLYNATNQFELKARQNIRYEPNESWNIGLRFSHRWLTIALATTPRKIQDKNKGTTDFFNIVLNSYGKRVGCDAYYLSYSGYYISNPRSIPSLATNYPNNSFPILPSLTTLTIGTNLFYTFNHDKYSYRATFLQNEIQKKSAGSVILTAGYSYYRINSDTGIIPTDAYPYIKPQARITDGTFNSFSIMPGYSFTLVGFKRLFITLSPSMGAMVQTQSYLIENAERIKGSINIVPRAMARFGFGYNTPKFYGGFSGIIDNYNIPLAKGDVLVYTIGSASLYIGYRFNVPKSLEKASAALNNISPAYWFKKKP